MEAAVISLWTLLTYIINSKPWEKLVLAESYLLERDGRGVLSLTDSAFFSTAEKHSYESESASNSSMVMIVAILVGVLGTVAIGLIVAVVIITRRRSIPGKGASLIVAEEM